MVTTGANRIKYATPTPTIPNFSLRRPTKGPINVIILSKDIKDPPIYVVCPNEDRQKHQIKKIGIFYLKKSPDIYKKGGIKMGLLDLFLFGMAFGAGYLIGTKAIKLLIKE